VSYVLATGKFKQHKKIMHFYPSNDKEKELGKIAKEYEERENHGQKRQSLYFRGIKSITSLEDTQASLPHSSERLF
jgi:hypothetical protein